MQLIDIKFNKKNQTCFYFLEKDQRPKSLAQKKIFDIVASKQTVKFVKR